MHEDDLAVRRRVLDYGSAVLAEGRVGRPEGSEDGRGCRVHVCFGDDLVGNFINQPNSITY